MSESAGKYSTVATLIVEDSSSISLRRQTQDNIKARCFQGRGTCHLATLLGCTVRIWEKGEQFSLVPESEHR